MKVTLKRLNSALHFEGKNEEGNTVLIDGLSDFGGEGKGCRPMELLLVSLASCSSMDVVSILKKMRQPLEDLRVEAEGERVTGEIPAVFKKIHIRYIVTGNLNPEKVTTAISKSMDKYCSVSKMLEKSVEITWSYQIEPGAQQNH